MTTYYVNGSTGKDTNAGTSEGIPWQSIHRVNEAALKPGDTVFFKGGVEPTKGGSSYLGPSISGESGKPITYGSYGTGKAILPTTAEFPHIFIASVSWLVFENLKLSAASVNEAKWASAGGLESGAKGSGCANITVKGCEFLWDNIFILAARKEDADWIIENCIMEHSYESGIYAQGLEGVFPVGWKIRKNKITQFGEGEATVGFGCHGVYARLKEAEIKENEFVASKKCTADSISLRGPGTVVTGNIIDGNGTAQGIAYYTYSKERGTTKIAYNKIFNCPTFCFYCDSEPVVPEEGQGDIGESFTIINNTFDSNAKTIVEADFRNAKHEKKTEHLATMKWIFKNNIVNGGASTGTIYIILTEEAGMLEVYEEDYNLFGINGTQAYRIYTTSYASYKAFHEGLGGSHDKNASPEYEVGEPAYSPKLTSPMVQAGTTSVSGFTYTKWVWVSFEYNGIAPAIGAVEYT
jgi:hypothetical protein